MTCIDTDLVFCGVVLVNGLYCAISFFELSRDECEGLLCMYVMADSWLVSFG